jgi:hypothetical protein
VPRRNPVIDRTYRREPGRVNYWKEAAAYIGSYVIIYLPHTGRWKQAWLCGILPGRDQFVIRWRKGGKPNVMTGIWRVHMPQLFALEREGGRMLPTPVYRDKLLPQPINALGQKGALMATSSKKGSTKTTPAETNGGTKRAVNDKLEGLTEVKRRNIAKFITKERAKSPATSWPKITEAVEAKYGWALPGSMTGRRLMREYGPDNAEEAIIKQERSATPRKRGAKKADPNAEALAGLSRTELKELIAEEGLEVKVLKKHTEDDIRANILAAGWTVEDATEDEEEDEATEDEVDDEEEEDTDEEEDDTEDEADEDEDEEDDTPAPVAKKVAVKRAPKPKPAAKAKPAAKRKPAAKPNPSK